MPVDVGRVGVVPVFLKLLPKNTFRRELFLQGARKDEKFVKFRRPKDAKCWLWHSKNYIHLIRSNYTHRAIQFSLVVHGEV